MPEDHDSIAPGRLARWVLFALALITAIVFYFRDGRSVPPLTAPASSSDTTR